MAGMTTEPDAGTGTVQRVIATVDDLEAEAAIGGPAPLSALDQAAGSGRVADAVRGLLAETAPAQVPDRLRDLLARVEAETTVEAGLPAAELDRRDGAAAAADRLRAAVDQTDDQAIHDTGDYATADATEAGHVVSEVVGEVADDAEEWGT